MATTPSVVTACSSCSTRQRGDSLFIVFYQNGAQRDCKYTADQFGFYHYKDVRVKVDHHDSDALILSKGKDKWYFDRVF